MAAIAGTAGIWTAGAAAHPAAMTRPAGQVRQASPDRALVVPSAADRSQPQLDALLVVAAAPKGTVVTSTVVKGHRRGPATPRQIARSMFRHFGWSQRQFRYLNPLWSHESSWNVRAANAYSGAYGIPQAVPGAKMASAGRHWRTNAWTQIRWGLRYIKDRYGSPRGAWDHELATGWY